MNFLKDFCSIGISFCCDDFRLFYFIVTTAVFVLCTLFCIEYFKGEKNTKRFFVFWVITYGAVVGFLFSRDLFTMFMFFEIMSVASTFWVLQEENEESDYAGRLYLRISIICGLVMLYGIILIFHETGELDLGRLQLMCNVSLLGTSYDFSVIKAGAIMLLIGFGAKAGIFLLHVWLPRAHTVAPAPASAVLSGILTKTGIIGIILTSTSFGLISDESWGKLLMFIGACTMFVGAALAVFSTNLKRTLACSSVSQIGFIVTGISCMVLSENGAAAYVGTITHMLNHSVIKLMLFLIAGGVLKKTGSLELNKIRGYGRNKPLLMIPFAAGGLSLAGVPLFSGYISKTLLHESVEELAEEIPMAGIVNIVFTITGGITLCYMLKLFICLFVEKGEAEKKPMITPLSTSCVLIPTAFLLLIGIVPKETVKFMLNRQLNDFMSCLSVKVGTSEVLSGAVWDELLQMKWFSFQTMKGGLISIAIGIVLYLTLVRLCLMKKENGRIYVNALPKCFDLEKYVYRPVVIYFLPFVFACLSRILDKMTDLIAYFIKVKVFKAIMNKRGERVETGISYALGSVLDFFRGKRHPGEKTYTEKMAVIKAETGEMARMLERSLSLSLLLFSVGLLITLFYMVLK